MEIEFENKLTKKDCINAQRLFQRPRKFVKFLGGFFIFMCFIGVLGIFIQKKYLFGTLFLIFALIFCFGGLRLLYWWLGSEVFRIYKKLSKGMQSTWKVNDKEINIVDKSEDKHKQVNNTSIFKWSYFKGYRAKENLVVLFINRDFIFPGFFPITPLGFKNEQNWREFIKLVKSNLSEL